MQFPHVQAYMDSEKMSIFEGKSKRLKDQNFAFLPNLPKDFYIIFINLTLLVKNSLISTKILLFVPFKTRKIHIYENNVGKAVFEPFINAKVLLRANSENYFNFVSAKSQNFKNFAFSPFGYTGSSVFKE